MTRNEKNNSSYDRKQSQNSSTAEPTNREASVAQIKGEVDRVWVKCMEAEEKSKLLRTLLWEGIGTNEIESHAEKQSFKKMERERGKRDVDMIRRELRRKLVDNEEFAECLRKERGRKRTQLEKKIGAKGPEYK